MGDSASKYRLTYLVATGLKVRVPTRKIGNVVNFLARLLCK